MITTETKADEEEASEKLEARSERHSGISFDSPLGSPENHGSNELMNEPEIQRVPDSDILATYEEDGVVKYVIRNQYSAMYSRWKDSRKAKFKFASNGRFEMSMKDGWREISDGYNKLCFQISRFQLSSTTTVEDYDDIDFNLFLSR